MGEEKWWAAKTATVNGVFKGGGAKGLLYAGALAAVEERGYWFRATAGSSAGAITAALIAAGMTVEQLSAAVPEALSHVKRNYLADVVGQPIVVTKKLRGWLDETLRSQVRSFGGVVGDEEAVTFQQLWQATGIELYVVAVDVARRQPVVFHHALTPGLSVATALIASSSIPLAFRPGRLEVEYADGTTAVHRLMDGGVWANYPAFVFKDASFREHHRLAEPPSGSTTIGFTLDSPEPVPAGRPVRLLTSWNAVQQDRGAMLRGWLRFAPVRLYLLTIVPLVIVLQAGWTIDRYGLLFLKDTVADGQLGGAVVSIAGAFDGFFSAFWPAFVLLLIVGGLIALVLALLGATILDSAIPAMKALMAVSTNVPYWIGTTAEDHVVRLSVPAGLDTFSFDIDETTRTANIAAAQVESCRQLEEILG
jgi:NTE family protein